MAVAMTGAVMNRARCVVPSHTIYPVARPCAVRTHHSQSHKAARLPSRLLRPAFNTAAAERAVLGLWPSIRPVTCIDSELGSTLTVRRAHRELLAAACIDINVVRKVIVTPHCVPCEGKNAKFRRKVRKNRPISSIFRESCALANLQSDEHRRNFSHTNKSQGSAQ